MITQPLIYFGQAALAIKEDIAYITGTYQSVSDLTTLETDELASPYATFEQDFWLLDGNYKFVPTGSTKAGYVGYHLSGATGSFSVPQTLTVGFNSVHTTNNFYVHFSEDTGDWISKMQIQFFDASNNSIFQDIVFPTGTTYHVSHDVGDEITPFKKLILTFYMTNKPYRVARVQRLDFETVTEFSGTDIKSCTLVEELNPTSSELPINTCEFSLFSPSASASIVNPTGSYSILQYHAPLDVYEQYGGLRMYMGRFYVDEWDSPTTSELHFRCVDALGILDGEKYHGWIASELVTDVLNDILGDVADYDLDSAFSGQLISGFAPVSSRREALQHLMFGMQATASCARSKNVVIRKSGLPTGTPTYTISLAEEHIDSLKLLPEVTGLSYDREEWEQSTDPPAQFYSQSFVSGSYTLFLDDPYYNISVSGATMTYPTGSFYDGVFAVQFYRTTSGVVSFSGSPMLLIHRPYSIQNSSPSGKPNVLQALATTLYFNDPDMVRWFYNYYQQRHVHKCRLYGHTVKTGDVVLIDTLGDAQLKGAVTKLSIDMSGGFRIDAEIVGRIV